MSIRTRRSLLTLLCVALGCLAPSVHAAPPTASAEKWDLARWLREAEARSPALREAREEIGVRAAKVLDAAWGRFPSLRWESVFVPAPTLEGDVFSTKTPVNDFAGFAGVYQSHRLDFWLPAFTFGKLRAPARAARANETAGRMDLERAWLVLRGDVRRAFDAVKLHRALGSVLDAARKELTLADRKLEELLEAGGQDVDELDKNRFATQLADLNVQRADFAKQEAAALAELQATVGLPPQHEGATVDDAPPAPRFVRAGAESDTRRAAVSSARKDLASGRASVDAKAAAFDTAAAGYWPDLFLSGAVGLARCNVCADQRNPFQLDFVNFDYLSLSAGVRWGLDYGVRVARARQARAEWRKAAAVQRGAEANAGQEVSAAWHRYAEARARVAVIQKGLDAAEAWHRGSSKEFLAGKGRASDYAESLSIVLRFRQDALRAVHQVSFAASTLELAAGVEL